jgi:hypothetical protein
VGLGGVHVLVDPNDQRTPDLGARHHHRKNE